MKYDSGMEKDVEKVKAASLVLSSSSLSVRNNALLLIASALWENRAYIFDENRKDILNASGSVSASVLKRLKFDEGKLKSVLEALDDVIKLPDPVGKTLEKRELDEGLILTRKSYPIGVIAMIFEARPDALVQIASLAIKSGNGLILKGGKEAALSNRALFSVIKEALKKSGVPEDSILLAQSHEDVNALLKLDSYIDLIIPRGSNSFVRYVMENTKIPVLGHADGICSIYVDESANIDMAVAVVRDSKAQYPSACNAVETVLVNEKIKDAFLSLLKEALDKEGVRIRGTESVRKIIDCELASGDDFNTEFLSLTLAVKTVKDTAEAIEHINSHGSHHTDAIITESAENRDLFFALVDSADVFHNASTRFADGYRFGLGAEVGISTSKIHARGPVGLSGLMSYKWLLDGNGEVVKDYAEGRKRFHHKDLI